MWVRHYVRPSPAIAVSPGVHELLPPCGHSNQLHSLLHVAKFGFVVNSLFLQVSVLSLVMYAAMAHGVYFLTCLIAE